MSCLVRSTTNVLVILLTKNDNDNAEISANWCLVRSTVYLCIQENPKIHSSTLRLE